MAVSDEIITRAAERLWQAEQTRRPCQPIRDLVGSHDVEAAYAIQQENIARHVRAGRRISGRKIGLTARAVQEQMGVDRPDFGALFADTEYGHGSTIPFERVIGPRVEAEVVLVLGEDLDREDVTFTEVIGATAFVAASLEIVDCRLVDWDIRITDTVADNAAAGLYVVGSRTRSIHDVDLASATMTLHRNGQQVCTGRGSDSLGHPVNATVWLARTLARMGTPLKAGDAVLTGALGKMVPASPGDVFEATIDGLGTAAVTFGAA